MKDRGGAKMWCTPELWYRKILKDTEKLFQVSHRPRKTFSSVSKTRKTLKMSSHYLCMRHFPRCSVSQPRCLFQKCCHRCHWKTNELTGKFRRWRQHSTFYVTHHPPWTFDAFSFLIFWTCARTAVNNYNVELLQLEFMRLSQLPAGPISHYLLLFRRNTRCGAHAAQLKNDAHGCDNYLTLSSPISAEHTVYWCSLNPAEKK